MKKLLLIMAVATIATACQDKTMPQAVLPDIDTSNPLLAEWNTDFATPPFELIKSEDYEPAFDAAIAVSRAEVDAIINNPAKPTFYNTIVALERQGELLGRISGLFFNIIEANKDDILEETSLKVMPKLTELSNDIALSPELFARVKAVYEHPGLGLDKEDKRLLENTYKSFVRNGANLSDEDKATYRLLTEELSNLTLKFGQNALEATNAFALNITDPKVVEELPDFVKATLSSYAKERGEKGWTVTLKADSYSQFLKYSSNRELKEKVWKAYNTRALGGDSDNSPVVLRITELRMKIAQLLGYKCYADYVLENRMAESTSNVQAFIQELFDSTIDYAKQDLNDIAEFAKANGLEGEMMEWDTLYYCEKYRKEKYDVSDEDVKPYFQLENVRDAIFMLANRLYGITFSPAQNVSVYHPDVTTFEVKDEKGEFLAVLYLDFFPRASKRAGAWMTEFRGAKGDTRPLVSLVMNFTKPTEDTPSLITHGEFETFAHEFGHSLHGMLAKGKYESLNGTNVYRDFVELPSQIMENWCTEKEYLNLWAKHYKTGKQMPDELINKLIDAKNFQAARGCVRQLFYGMLDMAWHTLEEPYTGDVAEFEARATAPACLQPSCGRCVSTAFTHLFSGGYAAGYYGYKWAEVLAADGFSLFKETGIFNQKTASKFRALLEGGNKEHPMTLYTRFRGHKPETKALIDQMGLSGDR